MSMPEQSGRLRLLLHSCCGPCSTATVERLADRYELTLFFYNPNITDAEEYAARLAAQQTFIKSWNAGCAAGQTLGFVEGTYEPERFLKTVKGLEGQPEGGERCRRCFQLRLLETAEQAAAGVYGAFTTTLTISPHKNSQIIAAVGEQVAAQAGVGYLAEDFKKHDGYRRSVELARRYNLYRQDYCGCCFSKKQIKERI